jgi:hypothetical protein
MRLLLGSGGFRTPERVAFLAAQMRSFFGSLDRLLFIPYALQDHDGYVRTTIERGIHAGYTLDGIHTHPDPALRARPRRSSSEAGTRFGCSTACTVSGCFRARERSAAGCPTWDQCRLQRRLSDDPDDQ